MFLVFYSTGVFPSENHENILDDDVFYLFFVYLVEDLVVSQYRSFNDWQLAIEGLHINQKRKFRVSRRTKLDHSLWSDSVLSQTTGSD